MEGSELEVTGVSRSGRVRKKPSKLTDFQSAEDVDRHKKKNDKSDAFGSPSSTPRSMQKKGLAMKVDTHSEEEETYTPVANYTIKKQTTYSDSDTDVGDMNTTNESSLDSLGSEVDNPEDESDENAQMKTQRKNQKEVLHRISMNSVVAQAQSLYMSEKSNKRKLIVKNGQIIGRMKAQRKDKGKTRLTAYMLWAKEIRQELMRGNPDLDFSQTSKRLGELWSTVPYNEKYMWKKRAKKIASQGGLKEDSLISTVTASPKKKSPQVRKFINKQPSGGGQLAGVSSVGKIAASPPDPPAKSGRSSALVAEPVVGPGLYKVVGTQPIDVSAHLRLLGESLTIIGERLKEHEGQIAVSGSLSVLLDSLLCALGPLLCLTQQVPEMSTGCPQQTLSKILDNIAYIMPGL